MRPHHEIGVGATQELSLRVSVGVLVRVLFHNPENAQTMLALERTATLRQIEGRAQVRVKAKPFGGAVRLINPEALENQIGYFHYDSERSREEGDFRIQIRPASWENVKEICHHHLDKTEMGILDSNPERELGEEFEDTLHVKVMPNYYQLKPRGLMIENQPTETENVRVEKLPTVRVYYIFEAWMQTPETISMMLTNTRYSDSDLEKMAWDEAAHGGKGRANGILVLGLDDLKEIYRSIPLGNRGEPVLVEGHQLDGNVPAILEEVETPKYQRYR